MRTRASPDARVAVLVSQLPSQQLVGSVRCRMRYAKRVRYYQCMLWHSRGNLGTTAECFHSSNDSLESYWKSSILLSFRKAMSAPQGLNDCSRGYATQLDNQDRLRHLRKEFIVPTKADLKSKTLGNPGKTCIFRTPASSRS